MDGAWITEAAQSYDRVAVPYVSVVRDGLDNLPFESSLVTYFAGQVRATGGRRVIDLGCGPGFLARHLASLGLSVLGVDVSSAMLRIARENNPDEEFLKASLTDLPVSDLSVAGVFCWYVMHHVPEDGLNQAFGEIARVLRPGGQLMLGSHVGDSTYVKTEGYGGMPMSVLFARRGIDTYADLVRTAGLVVDSTIELGPDRPAAAAVLLAHKPL